MKYGEPRCTKDLDVWVDSSAANSHRLVEALKEFGAFNNFRGLVCLYRVVLGEIAYHYVGL